MLDALLQRNENGVASFNGIDVAVLPDFLIVYNKKSMTAQFVVFDGRGKWHFSLALMSACRIGIKNALVEHVEWETRFESNMCGLRACGPTECALCVQVARP